MRVCAKENCENEVTQPQQIYCSRTCSPLGHMRDSNAQGQGRPVKKLKPAKVPRRKHVLFGRGE